MMAARVSGGSSPEEDSTSLDPQNSHKTTNSTYENQPNGKEAAQDGDCWSRVYRCVKTFNNGERARDVHSL